MGRSKEEDEKGITGYETQVMNTVTFHPAAETEYLEASKWYEQKREGYGLKFEKAIDNKIRKIQSNPYLFSENRRSYRQASVRAFPFVIVYRYYSRKKDVFISGVYHTSRNPRGKFRKP